MAETVLARGDADMVSMARPFLADSDFVRKAGEGRADEINVCIGCNQACLDHVFAGERASCLVNPRACHETELVYAPAATPRRIAVVGAGPAGLACATVAAGRGHRVVLFEAASDIGGQFNLARRIPGKEEFNETLRYFRRQLELAGVELRLGTKVTAEDLAAGGFDHVVLATGVTPRRPPIPGIDHPSVIYYDELLSGRREAGPRVAIVGAGGIGFDVAEFLSQVGPSASLDPELFAREWGIDSNLSARGGVKEANIEESGERRDIYLLQRKTSRPGKGLGKTTGWIHRASLKARGVEAISGVSYEGVDDRGLHIATDGTARLLEVDSVIICAGQEPMRALASGLEAASVGFTLVGGAEEARELDAKRAIAQASRVAAEL